MADIELVIKIDEEMYETLRKNYVIIGGQRHRGGATPMSVIYNAVRKGTPLPKGHGRLIDGDELERQMKIGYKIVKSAPTIIEADTESEE